MLQFCGNVPAKIRGNRHVRECLSIQKRGARDVFQRISRAALILIWQPPLMLFFFFFSDPQKERKEKPAERHMQRADDCAVAMHTCTRVRIKHMHAWKQPRAVRRKVLVITPFLSLTAQRGQRQLPDRQRVSHTGSLPVHVAIVGSYKWTTACVCVWANESLLQPLHRCFVGHHHFIPPQADWAGRRAVKTGFSSAVCSHDFTGGGTPLSALNALTAGTDGRHAAWRVTVGAVVLHPKAHLTVEGENTGRIIRQGCSIYSLHTTYHSGFKQLHAYIHIHIRQLIIPRAKVPARWSDARLFFLSLSLSLFPKWRWPLSCETSHRHREWVIAIMRVNGNLEL